MSHWECKNCGHEVYTMDDERPSPIKWTDGHICHFIPTPDIHLDLKGNKDDQGHKVYREGKLTANNGSIWPIKRVFEE